MHLAHPPFWLLSKRKTKTNGVLACFCWRCIQESCGLWWWRKCERALQNSHWMTLTFKNHWFLNSTQVGIHSKNLGFFLVLGLGKASFYLFWKTPIDCVNKISNLINITSIPKARVSSVGKERVDIHILEIRIGT